MKQNRIESTVDVIVIGMGRVGLPQALLLADAGWTVHGVEIDEETLSDLRNGKTPFFEPGMAELLSRVLDNGRLRFVHGAQLGDLVPRARYVVISVGTRFDVEKRLTEQGDLFALVRRVYGFGPARGSTMVLRTTGPVGTTDRIRSIADSEFGLREGSDFHLVYVPERAAEGKAVEEEETLPKLVGSYSDEGFKRGSELFNGLRSEMIRLSSPSAAEFAKLTDNSYRNTVFAFANELAMAAEDKHLNVQEIIDACNAGYPRNNIPIPGPVSGYCLGKDPYLLGQALDQTDKSPAPPDYLWTRARQDNDGVVEHAAVQISEHVAQLEIQEPHVLVYGLAFKEGVDDFRMSHSFDMMRALLAKLPRLSLSMYDPAVNLNRYTAVPEDLLPSARAVTSNFDEALAAGADVVLISTPDACLRRLPGPGALARHDPTNPRNSLVVYDCWNLWKEAESTPEVVYRALGAGANQRVGH